MTDLLAAARAAASPVFGVPFSVLDVAPVSGDSTPATALADATALAVLVDRLGYHRLWYAEHHNMPGIASSAPDVLIANAGARTARIRLGSGGVMLPNHAPLVIAERFGTLEALHPGRIDLGIGRAPGTDQRTMQALRRIGSSDDLLELLQELYGYFKGFAPGTPFEGIHAVPGYGAGMPALWLLGSSGYSAQVAALMGLPFAFAHHFSAANTLAALELYRSRFEASPDLAEPYAQITVFLVCADTDDEAQLLASAMALSFAQRNTGRPPGPLPTMAQVRHHQWTDLERSYADGYLATQVVGSPATVRTRLEAILAETAANEIMAIASVPDAAARERSYTLLAELAQLPTP
ncbi:MAG TPA: LLM class flavin-dependent oxidoreductase [Gaiellales bacterium]